MEPAFAGGADMSVNKKSFFAMVGTICCLLMLAALIGGVMTGTDIFTDEDEESETTDNKLTYAPAPRPGPGFLKPEDTTLITKAVTEKTKVLSTQPRQTQPFPVTTKEIVMTYFSESATSEAEDMPTDPTEAETPAPDTTPEAATSAEITLSVETTTPKRAGLRRFTTVCTLSYHQEGLMVPPGDVCDYLFYDSLYMRPEDTFMGTFTNDYLKPFFDAAKATTKVRFGFSVHAPAVEGFTKEIRSDEGSKHYMQHWQHNIYGWGFLNIHELIVKSNPEVVKSALIALKELEEIAVAESRNASSMVIGLYCRPQTTCDQVAEYIKTVFTPGGLVILGHISHRDSNLTDCFILGPNIRALEGRKYENASYVHTVGNALEVVRYLQSVHGIDTMYAVSFTTAGRWYRPRYPDNQNAKAGKYRPGNACELGDYPQKAFAQEACDNTSLTYKSTFYYASYDSTTFAFDKKHGFTLTVENLEEIRRKVCTSWENNTDLLAGIAVYDANYDSAAKNCPPYQGAAWAFLNRFGDARDVLNVWGDRTSGNFTRKCYLMDRNG